ncbi:MAG: hypothetical protein U0944_03165 [Candidatus Moranbacteria bacterium]|nr:hypothetical protein [Candidatus Moranbacteria bacterium]
MFKNPNSTDPQDAVNVQQQNFSQDKDLKIEDVPIHTMAQDLYEIEHPNEKKDIAQEIPLKTVAVQNLTEKQKTSPFLNPITETVPEKTLPRTKTETTAEKIAPQAKTETAPELFKIDSQKNTEPASKNGALAILASILILTIVGAGVYYFLSIQKKNIEPAVVVSPEPAAPEPAVEQVPAPAPESAPELSTTNPNYLPIDIENSDSNTLKNTLDEYAQKVQSSAIPTSVEFLIVDQKNNPITFDVFAKKLGLALSPIVMQNIGADFSLFFYNDRSNMRLGLAIDSKNNALLKTSLSKEEKSLAQELQPLILPTGYEFNPATFGSGDYNGVAIKYLNASGIANLSVDYAISGKKLIIGTSKMTARAIIDYTLATDESSTAENIKVPTEESALIK